MEEISLLFLKFRQMAIFVKFAKCLIIKKNHLLNTINDKKNDVKITQMSQLHFVNISLSINLWQVLDL